MINLLPSETKKQLQASRKNLLLLKYSFVLLFAGAFLAIASVTVNMDLDSVQTLNANGSNLVGSSSSANTSEQIEKARNNLTNASEIINQQVSYNKILLSLANTLPKGVIVSSLNIDNETISSPVTIKLRANSQDNVAKLNSSFQNSSVFSGYQLTSNSTTAIDPSYPIDIMISININKATVK